MSNSFSFPVDPEASFVLERYLEELQQRILLQAATFAGNELNASVSKNDLYLSIFEFGSDEQNAFVNGPLKRLLDEEWKALNKTQPNGKVSPPNPEP